MIMGFLLFFLISLMLSKIVKADLRWLCFVVLSIGFFLLLEKSSAIVAYFVLVIINLLMLLSLKRFRMTSLRFVHFFPFFYSIIFIFLGGRKYIGWSYIILAAGTHLQESLKRDNGSLKSWLKEHIFTVISFPKVLMGPIDKGINQSDQCVWLGAQRFLWGLFKVGVVLQLFREFIPQPVEQGSPHGILSLFLLGLWHYINLYLEFSGVIDMVIGIFLVWGFRVKENFQAPWMAISITDFWRRWHITLGSWIKENIYIPLGGNRKGFKLQISNLLIAMVLCGLWHGLSYGFLAWGFLQGLGLSFEKIMNHFNIGYNRLPKAVTWAITQIFVIFSWVVFFSR